MKHLFIWSLVLNMGCIDALKEMLSEPEEDEEDEEEDSERYEGDKQGDCLDGEDNDDDGYIDCEDQGCDGKPACQDDTGIVDTGDTDTDTEDPFDIDDDGDGYSEYDGDCDDSDPSVYPGADDITIDGIDQDCNGIDGIDEDGDGYDITQDCDDFDENINPGAEDIPDDGIDQDCDGSDTLGASNTDDDGDGYTENEGDCDDTDGSIYPGAYDVEEDGIDQDCDGSDPFTPSSCCYTVNMMDSYGDGWNNAYLTLKKNGSSVDTFSLIGPQQSSGTDSFCAAVDSTFELFFTAGNDDHEISFELLDDDGAVLFSDASPNYGLQYGGYCRGTGVSPHTGTDSDGDGFSVDDGDCDDEDPYTYPGAYEFANDGIDQDCNGWDMGQSNLACTSSFTTNWEQIGDTIYSADYSSVASATCNGSVPWGTSGLPQSYQSYRGWVMRADWNNLWVENPIASSGWSTTEYAIEIGINVPGGNRTGFFGINQTQNSCTNPSGGIGITLSNGACPSGVNPCQDISWSTGSYAGGRSDIYNQFTTIRIEVFQATNEFQVEFDGNVDGCFTASSVDLTPGDILFSAQSTSISPLVGVGRIEFYRGY